MRAVSLLAILGAAACATPAGPGPALATGLELYLEDPRAPAGSVVRPAGNHDGWIPGAPLAEPSPGRFTGLLQLPAGEHHLQLQVVTPAGAEVWLPPTGCARSEPDGLGGTDCVIRLGP